MVQNNHDIGHFEIDFSKPKLWLVTEDAPDNLKLPGILGMLFPQPTRVVVAIIHDPLSNPVLEAYKPLPFAMICEIMRAVHEQQVLMN